MVSREDLGIREVDTAEALAAAGLRYVRCAAGEVVSQEVGLYLLDVETGAVEGWVLASAPAADAYEEAGGFIDAGVSLSPGNRFLSFDRFRHDRVTERTFEWDAPPLRRWGSDSERRLLFRLADERGDLFVVTDGALQPVAQFAIPDGQEGQLQWLNFEYRSLVVRGQERDRGLRPYLHFFDLGEETVGTFEPTATQLLPGTTNIWSEGRYRLSSLGSSIEVAIAGPDSCHVMHYGFYEGRSFRKADVAASSGCGAPPGASRAPRDAGSGACAELLTCLDVHSAPRHDSWLGDRRARPAGSLLLAHRGRCGSRIACPPAVPAHGVAR